MSESKFTPRPWKWKGDELWGEQPAEGIGSVQKMIGIFRGVAHPSVVAANKRLIETAPDLLEACRFAVGFCVAFRQDVPDWERFPEVGRLFALMSAVIAKAEGK